MKKNLEAGSNKPLLLAFVNSLLALALFAGCATKPCSLPPPPAPIATPDATATADDWTSLFNGRDLAGWQVADIAGHGEVTVRDGALVLGVGNAMTGVKRAAPPATLNYEVSLETRRLEGEDFFCALTFPVGTNHCSFIVGGWGGGVVGISSLNGYDASENETTAFMDFKSGPWYAIRVRVTADKIQAWIDGKRVVDVETAEKQISVRFGDIEQCQPFGLATYSTASAFRHLRFRPVTASEPGRK